MRRILYAMPPPAASATAPAEPAPTHHAPRLFGLGSMALASMVGGPLATWWLVDRNTRGIGLEHERRRAAWFFAAASPFWLWVQLHIPPDVLSQLIPHVLQLMPWTLFTVHLLRRHHQAHKAAGGTFRSAWAAFGLALLVSIALRVFLRLALLGAEQLSA